ncbi:MAG: YDG domain-containing protein [Christensenellaceae bacterium]|nr:YDG domain-containing protein [Christensenellaceae bacterium]
MGSYKNRNAMKGRSKLNRKKTPRNWHFIIVLVFVSIVISLAAVAISSTFLPAEAVITSVTQFTDYTIAYAPNSYYAKIAGNYTLTCMLPGVSGMYHTPEGEVNATPEADYTKYYELFGTTPEDKDGFRFEGDSASHSYIILDLGAPRLLARVEMRQRQWGNPADERDKIYRFTVYSTTDSTYNESAPPKEFFLNMRNNGYFIQRKQFVTTDKSQDNDRVLTLDQAVMTRYVAITMDNWRETTTDNMDNDIIAIDELRLFVETHNDYPSFYDDYDIVYAPMCTVIGIGSEYGSINTIKPGITTPTYYHPGSTTNGSNVARYEAAANTLRYVVLDLKAVKNVSQVIVERRTNDPKSFIARGAVYVSKDARAPDILTMSYFQSLTNNFTNVATFNEEKSPNGGSSDYQRSLLVEFTPTKARYLAFEVTDGGDQDGIGILSELRIGYHTGTQFVPAGEIPSNYTVDNSLLWYGNGTNINYTVAYAPDTSTAHANEQGAEQLNNGSRNGTPFFHSWYSGVRANNSAYGEIGSAQAANTSYANQYYYYFVLDLKMPRLVSGIQYIPRSDGDNSGKINKYEVYVDRGNLGGVVKGDKRLQYWNTTEWNKYFSSVGTGNWGDTYAWDSNGKYADFGGTYLARYVVLRAITTTNNVLSASEIFVAGANKPSTGATTLIYNEQQLWDYVSSAGVKTGRYMLANDIEVTNRPGYNYYNGADLNANQGSQATRLAYANHAYADSSSTTNNIFSGTLLGNGHTITYRLSSYNTLGDNVRWDTATGEPYGFHGLLTAHLWHGTIKDLTIIVDAPILLSSACGSSNNYHQYFGVVAGIATGQKDAQRSTIENVRVILKSNIIFRGTSLGDNTGAIGVTVGGFVGLVKAAGVDIINSTFEMADGVVLAAVGQAKYLSSANWRRNESFGRARVGGFIGEIFGVSGDFHPGRRVRIIDCELKSGSNSVMYANTYISVEGQVRNDAAVGGIVGVLTLGQHYATGTDATSITLEIDGLILSYKGVLAVTDTSNPNLEGYGYSGTATAGYPALGVCAAGLLIGGKGSWVAGTVTAVNAEFKNIYMTTTVTPTIKLRVYGLTAWGFGDFTYTNIAGSYSTLVATVSATTQFDGGYDQYTYDNNATGNYWVGKCNYGTNFISGNNRIDTSIKLGTDGGNILNGELNLTGFLDGAIKVVYQVKEADQILSAIQANTLTMIYDRKLQTLNQVFRRGGTPMVVYAMYYSNVQLDINANSPASVGNGLNLSNLASGSKYWSDSLYNKYYDGSGVTYELKPSSSFGNGYITTTNYASRLFVSDALQYDERYRVIAQNAWYPTNGGDASFTYTTVNKDVLPISGGGSGLDINFYCYVITDKAHPDESGGNYSRMVMFDTTSEWSPSRGQAVTATIPKYGVWQTGYYFVSFKIIPRPFSIVKGGNTLQKVYDSTNVLPTPIEGGLLGVSNKHFNYDGVGSELTITAVGTYDSKNVATGKTVTINFTIIGNGGAGYKVSNYAPATGIAMPDTSKNGSASLTFYSMGIITIKEFKAEKTGGYTKIYDGSTDITSIGTSGAYTLTGILEISTAVGKFSTKNVGPQSITVTLTINDNFDGKNYKITKGAGITNVTGASNGVGNNFTFSFDGSITAKQLTVSKGNSTYSRAYNKTNVATILNNETYYKISGLAGSDSIKQGDATFSSVNVGTDISITIKLTINDGSSSPQGKNYILVNGSGEISVGGQKENTHTFVITGNITPASLSITSVGRYSRAYDGTVDAGISSFYSVSGNVSSDTISLINTQQDMPKFSDKDVDTNKTITFRLAISDGNNGANYRFATPSGSDYILTATGSSNNFIITMSADITKAKVKVTPLEKSKIYGEDDPTISYNTTYPTTERFNLEGALTRSPKGTNPKRDDAGGTYVIVRGSLNVPDDYKNNFEIDFVSGVRFYITIKTINISIVNAFEKYYDTLTTADISKINGNQSNYFTMSNVTAGDDVVSTVTSATYPDANANTGGSVYNITIAISLTGTDCANYSVSNTYTISGKILPLPITIVKAGNPSFSKTYDGTVNYNGSISNFTILGDAKGLNKPIIDQIKEISMSKAFNDKNVLDAKTLSVTFSALILNTGYKQENYNFTQAIIAYTGTITPLSISFELSWNYPENFKYTAQTKTVSVKETSFSTEIYSEQLSIVCGYTGNTGVDAATYSAVALVTFNNGANNGLVSNYSPSATNTTLSWSIGRASLKVSAANANAVSRKYNGSTSAVKAGGYVLAGMIGSEIIDILGTSNYDTKNVGKGKNIILTGVTISATDPAKASNYVLEAGDGATIDNTTITLSGVGEITTADYSVTLTWDYDDAFIYNATSRQVRINNTFQLVSTQINTERLSFSFTYNAGAEGIDASKYDASVSVTVNNGDNGGLKSNYNNPTLDGTTLTWYILPATLTIKASGNNTIKKTYDESTTVKSNLSSGYTFSTLYSCDAGVVLSGDAQYSDKNVGKNKNVIVTGAKLTGTGYLNYTLTQGSGTTILGNTLTLIGVGEIEQLGLAIIDVIATSRTYNGQTTVVLTGGQLVTVLGNDQVGFNLGSGVISDKKAGTNKPVTTSITLTGTGVDHLNYLLKQPTNITVDIYKKNLTVSGMTASNRVYNASDEVALSSATLSGVVANDDVKYVGSTGYMQDKNVGDNKGVTTYLTLDGADSGNYTIIQPTNITVIITRKPLTLQWDYTQSLVFTGSSQKVSATVPRNITIGTNDAGIYKDDDVDIEFSNNEKRNAGTYTATSSLTGDDANNYQIAQNAQLKYTILPHKVVSEQFTFTHDIMLDGDITTAEYEFGVTAIIFDGESHTITLASHGDSLLNSLSVSIAVKFFGLCTCGLSEDIQYHSDHQLKLSNTGPIHAGSYWMLLSFTGTDANNFAFDDYGDGYDPTTYFSTDSNSVSLVTAGGEEIETLPLLSSNFEDHYSNCVLNFTILQSILGFQTNGTSDENITYDSIDHCVTKPQPNQSVQTNEIIVLVYDQFEYNLSTGKYIVDEEEASKFTYQEYTANGAGSKGGVINAGTYLVVFVISNASSTDSVDCDYANGSVPSISIKLTINPKEIKIIPNTVLVGTSTPTKVYNGNIVNYTDYYLLPTIAALDSKATDGQIITGTSVSILATFDSAFVDATKISFTLSDSDKDNYFIPDMAATITKKQIEVTYHITNSFEYNASTRNYRPTIGGIISEDENEANYISVTYSGDSGVSADSYVSKVFITGSRASNYELSQYESDWTITKKRVNVELKSDFGHVYDGMTTLEIFGGSYKSIGQSLLIMANPFYLRDTITGQIGVVTTAGDDTLAIYPGIHELKFLQSLTSSDTNGKNNYIITEIGKKEYTIKKRSITIVYSNIMQSMTGLNTEDDLLPVGISSIQNNTSKNGTERDGFNFTALITNDGLRRNAIKDGNEEETVIYEGISVDNSLWKDDYKQKSNPPYYAKTLGLLNKPSEMDAYYEFKVPRLIIIGFEIVPGKTDTFYVNNIDDFLSLHYLIDGLKDESIIPIFYQSANIDGIVDYQRSIYIPALILPVPLKLC